MTPKTILLALALPLALPATASACEPSPSCWLKSHPATLKDTCRGYAANRDTVRQIAVHMKDQQKAALFVSVCRRLGVVLPD
jgi:hypothetical protein